ncbi:MAG: aldose 1-epimerase [Gorillibacterium sp.]|nr:aldose 1-epimerase [Gorillibacterium sp.]
MENFLENIEFLGEAAVCARNAELEMIIVPAWGSTVVSLKHRRTGVEILRSPQSKEQFWMNPALYGTPVLFPPNRIEDGAFTWNGQDYQFDCNEEKLGNHIHGFVMRKKWELTGARYEAGRVVIETLFDSSKDLEVLRQFPHPFTILLTFELEDSILKQTATITNTGKESFPWGLGYHTTFNFPFVPSDPLSACRFSLTADKQWELTERFVPTGKLLEIPDALALNGAGITLVDRPLDDAFLSLVGAGGERNEAVLTDETSGIVVTYEADAHFKHWVIYNNDSTKGYLCPEPYTWITNAPNLDLDTALTGLAVLEPGKETIVHCQIKVAVQD